MTSQYNNAITYYETYLGRDVPDADYATFQQSLCFGLVEDNQKKASSLESLVKQYPNSVYATDAYFELGETYMKMGQENEAETIFTSFINDYPKSQIY